MISNAQPEDRAVGTGLFVRAQGRDRDQAIAWMRAAGFDDASAAVAWERSAERYRALFRRLALRDITVTACLVGLATLVAGVSYLLQWGLPAYLIAVALLLAVPYVARNVPARLRGEPSGADRELQRWMRDRYPDLPAQ